MFALVIQLNISTTGLLARWESKAAWLAYLDICEIGEVSFSFLFSRRWGGGVEVLVGFTLRWNRGDCHWTVSGW